MLETDDFVVVIEGESRGLVGVIEGVSEPYTFDVRFSDGTLDIVPSSSLKKITKQEYSKFRNAEFSKSLDKTRLEEIRIHLSKTFKHEYTTESTVSFLIAHFHNQNYDDIKKDNRLRSEEK